MTTSAFDPVMLFQYGSNMSAARLKSQIEKHKRLAPVGMSLEIRPVSRARLQSWRLAFDLFSHGNECLVSDIVEGGDGDETWGGVYELERGLVETSDDSRSVMDRIEGRLTDSGEENYDRRIVDVDLNGEVVAAYTYIGIESARARCRNDHPDATVTHEYAAAVLDGAADFGLPCEYVASLRATLDALACNAGP